MFKLKQVDYLVVHCAATRPSADIGVKEITGWHKERGFTTIGYHKVIRRDGTVENGRDEQYAGAHVKGYNSKSLGVSLVGGVREDDPSVAEANFTPAQYMALANLLHDWMAKYPAQSSWDTVTCLPTQTLMGFLPRMNG